VSTVNALVVADDVLVAASVTLIVMVCVPSSTVGVNGDVQLASGARSTWHCVLVGAPAVVNVTVGVESLLVAAGWPVIATVGATVSTVNELVEALLELPAPSLTRTVTECAPSATVGANGELHAANAPASSWHSITVGAPVVVNVTVAVELFDSAAG
jgi:hypothetical protein